MNKNFYKIITDLENKIITFVWNKILDILIFKIFGNKIEHYINLNYFEYSKELIISIIIFVLVLLMGFFQY
jgi:hypothetical protein